MIKTEESVPPTGIRWVEEGQSLSTWLRETVRTGDVTAVPRQPEADPWATHSDGIYAVTRATDEWLLGLHLRARQGIYHVVEAAFVPLDDEAANSLSTALLRTVALGRVVDDARRRAAPILQAAEMPGAEMDDLLTIWREDHRTQSGSRPEWAWAVLAARYVNLVNEGDRRPSVTLAEELTTTPALISQRVREARERGLLTKTTPGKLGGELTEKGRLQVFDMVDSLRLDAHRQQLDEAEYEASLAAEAETTPSSTTTED